MRCGLLGEKLGHSYSPALHALFGDYDYELFEVSPDRLGDFLRVRDFQGLNVTIPYKTTMLAICDDLTETAATIGSVNTVLKQLDGSLLGDNTDAAGFEGMVWKSRIRILGRKCLVLGSGGASLSAQYVLRKLGAGEVVVISRTGENNYDNLDRHQDAAVIVNATPVGMYPNTAASPVDLRQFPHCEGVLDLIYNPARTALLQQAETLGIPHLGGLYMLAEQARCAAQLFTGEVIPAIRTQEAYRTLRSRMENRILVGMPGCGKSTVGRALAAQLDRPFVDTDAELEKVLHMPVGEYITHYGEEAFRKEETPSGPAGEILGPGDCHRRGLRHPAGELPPPPPKRRHFLPGAGPVQTAEEGAPPLPEGEPGGHVHHPSAHVPPLCGHHRGQRRPGREGGPEVGGSL